MTPRETAVAGDALGEVELRPQRLEVDRLLDDPRTRIIVCCGSGGVGKTTTAAALGLRAAERGRHVVVLTVDPARRLAQSMGLTSLDNTPRPVPLPGHGDAGGSLHAMMLDMKRTFDEIVETHSDPDRAAQILANPFYQSLSSSFAGTQEYMAMEKLGQLRRADEWDLIVVDTPPSRSALDFLDAPQRLSRFLDGRLIRLLTAPTRASSRAYLKVVNAGFGMFTGVVTKVLGTQLLRDVQTFVAAFDTMFGGFRERAEDTYRLLQTPGTAFLVIATPEPDALREASYFVERLSEDRMPLAGRCRHGWQRGGRQRLTPGGAERRCRGCRRGSASPACGDGVAAARGADAARRRRAPACAAFHGGSSGSADRPHPCPAAGCTRPGRTEDHRREFRRQLADRGRDQRVAVREDRRT
jgi:anion-transporting  ArsA/GET3 family ATPase